MYSYIAQVVDSSILFFDNLKIDKILVWTILWLEVIICSLKALFSSASLLTLFRLSTFQLLHYLLFSTFYELSGYVVGLMLNPTRVSTAVYWGFITLLLLPDIFPISLHMIWYSNTFSDMLDIICEPCCW